MANEIANGSVSVIANHTDHIPSAGPTIRWVPHRYEK